MFEELMEKMFPTEESFNELVDEYSSELKFASQRIEQGNDVYQYLLSVTKEQAILEKLVALLASQYAGTEFNDSIEKTVANRFEFTVEDFIPDEE